MKTAKDPKQKTPRARTTKSKADHDPLHRDLSFIFDNPSKWKKFSTLFQFTQRGVITKKKTAAIKLMEQLTGGPITLGKLLEAIRLGSGCSQTELAKKLAVSRAHLSDIENGRRIVSPERAARWAKVLGYSPERFVKLAVQDSLNKAGLKLQVEVRAA